MLRIVAILAVYNERRYIQASLDHHIAQGLEVYLIDNESTDDTVRLAETYLGRGLIGIETFPRDGVIRWVDMMERKEWLASTLDADWFVHVDADEFRVAPAHRSLAEGIAQADLAGYNAVNFMEYTFIPTLEDPDHDHSGFQTTMRHYYPFLPFSPHRLNAWKRQPEPVDLKSSAGHAVSFPGLKIAPENFAMRHYFCLSASHAIEKYAARRYATEDTDRGWHGWRGRVDAERITFPSRTELREYESDQMLDSSTPSTRHYAFSWAREGGIDAAE